MPKRSPAASAIRPCNRAFPVGAVEADQCGRRAGVAAGGLGDLEHRAIAVRPTAVCRAEEVPGGVGDQTGNGFCPVGAIEADQCGRRAGVAAAGLGDLEHRAIAVRPAAACRAEEVPGGVGDQTGIRVCPVGAVEADQCGRRAGVAAAGLGDLEHRAIAVRPAD